MQEPTIGAALTAEHREIDAGIKAVIDGGSDLAPLREALALLRRHIHVEETALFPPLAAAGLTMPVFVMKREHGQMWPLLDALEKACAEGATAESLREDCEHLFRLLQIHNGKEEQIVYGAADRQAAADDDNVLAEAIAAAAMPEGWTCEMAGRGGPPGFPPPPPFPPSAA